MRLTIECESPLDVPLKLVQNPAHKFTFTRWNRDPLNYLTNGVCAESVRMLGRRLDFLGSCHPCI